MNTDSLKLILAFAMSMHKSYEGAQADGKIAVDDLPHLMDPMMKLLPAIQAAKNVPAEIKDLSDQERSDLMVWAKAEYDIADDVLEAKVEAGLAMVLHLASFLGVIGVIGGDAAPAPTA